MTPRVIALDGPAAAGKSTVGAGLAREIGMLFFDTGLLYRALTALVLRRRVDPLDGPAVAALAEEIKVVAVDGQLGVAAPDNSLAGRLNSPEVDAAVSEVSRRPEVRLRLLAAQRAVPQLGPVILVGRDIGTVVMPDADMKVYLDASPGERARRRFRQALGRGESVRYRDVLAGILARDEADSNRVAAPLAVASDAVVFVTDDCTAAQAIAWLTKAARAWNTAALAGQRVVCRPEEVIESAAVDPGATR